MTAPAFLDAMERAGVRDELCGAVEQAAAASPDKVAHIAADARAAIRRAGTPGELVRQIDEAFRALFASWSPEPSSMMSPATTWLTPTSTAASSRTHAGLWRTEQLESSQGPGER